MPEVKNNLHIRWMIRRDMPEVLDIESRTFDFAWNENDFIRCLRQRNCIGMVIHKTETPDYSDPIIGYMIYELHKTKLHILNFAVDYDNRRQRVGTALMQKLVDKLSADRRTKLTLAVRETNLDAQLFFKSLGFRATSVLKDFYDDTDEDSYFMEYEYKTSKDKQLIGR